MAANSQNYGSLPEIVPTSAPKTSKRRAIASVAVAVMMFAAGAAALSSKTTATAPAALVEYDGSGVTWDCAVPDSQVAASNGPASGTIESAGYIAPRETPSTRVVFHAAPTK